MKSATIILLISQLVFQLACAGTSKNRENDLDEVNKILAEKQNGEEPSTEKIQMNNGKLLNEFVLEGYSILDTTRGDLNLDDYSDYVLVLKSNKEDKDEEIDELSRPLLLLLGTGNNKYTLAGRNDRVVYCKECGGIWGDPFEGISIKYGYFSVEHYGGSNWRWTRIITFKYAKEENDWFLHKDGGDSYHTSEPEKATTELKTTKDFGKVAFEKFNNF